MLILRLRRTGLWLRHKRAILLGAVALYAVDAAIALPRIAYAWRAPNEPVIHRTIPLPASLVLVNVPCGQECNARLLSGALDEVILVRTNSSQPETALPPQRYRVGWTPAGSCPPERRRAIPHDAGAILVETGFCPIVEATEIPREGVFVVHETFLVGANHKAAPFTPAYLTNGPPGKTIEFRALEVQRRTSSGIEVIAEQRSYKAPGFIGLPPLIGCWARPDNIIWVMPPGDTGCGLWRWFTWGGDPVRDRKPDWVFGKVLTPPDRATAPPRRPE
jgi:hypothetical protein